MENLKESTFMESFRKNKNYMKEIWRGKFTKDDVAKEFRNIISYKCIPQKVYEDNKTLIDKLFETYSTEEGVDKENARLELNMYTLNLGIYDKGKYSILKHIGSEQIYFVNGNYSYELGFERDKQEVENTFDSFL
ncbi:MAG: hypothetical protein ACRC8M_08540 [Cetobacterium sp.]|uniref:hypothetical protein n=1 Tax=Cetobacterium sp. TaxID=2071632 RepID=UPI003F30301A